MQFEHRIQYRPDFMVDKIDTSLTLLMYEKSDEQRHNVNWNFVDADCVEAMHSDVQEQLDYTDGSITDWDAYYEEFDALCNAYEKKYDEVFA